MGSSGQGHLGAPCTPPSFGESIQVTEISREGENIKRYALKKKMHEEEASHTMLKDILAAIQDSGVGLGWGQICLEEELNRCLQMAWRPGRCL